MSLDWGPRFSGPRPPLRRHHTARSLPAGLLPVLESAAAGGTAGLEGRRIRKGKFRPQVPKHVLDTLGITLPPAPVPAPVRAPSAVPGALPTIGLLSSPSIPTTDPQTAYENAVFYGTHPDPVDFRGLPHGQELLHTIEEAAHTHVREGENLGEPEDLTNLALLVGGGAGVRAFKAAGEAALGAAEGATATTAAEQVSRVPKALQVAGRVASAPLRHPIATASAPVAAEVPGAIASGNPNQLLHGFTGAGVLASILGKAGGSTRGTVPGIAGAALGDLIELPAQVLPSTYLPLAAGVEAAQGHPEKLTALQQGFRDSSFLGQLALNHSVGGAVTAAEEHPLYAVLEGLGVKSAVGHGINEGARRFGTADAKARAAPGRARPDLNIYDQVSQEQNPFSRDYFKRRREEGRDAARGAPVNDRGDLQATPKEIRKFLQRYTDQSVFANEAVRKGHIARDEHGINEVAPKKKSDREVVASLQSQGIISADPHQALLDLESYRRDLIAQQPHLQKVELGPNRQLVKDLGAAIKGGHFDNLDLLKRYVDLQRPIDEVLAGGGVLDPAQAEKARAIPYARRHMGADYGATNETQALISETLHGLSGSGLTNQERGALLGRLTSLRSKNEILDQHGNPLDTATIHEHMRANNGAPVVDPELLGYVSQATPRGDGTPSSTFYQPPVEHPSAPNKRRTGAATEKGTFDATLQGMKDSLRHGRTIAEKLKGFKANVDHVALKDPQGRPFDNWDQAKHFLEHPEDFGAELPPIPGGWVPLRTSPFLATKGVLESGHELGQNRAKEAIPPELTLDNADGSEFGHELMKQAEDPNGKGPVVLVPKIIRDRLTEHYRPSNTIERAAQAVVGTFKGTQLTTSPSWLGGNAIDTWLIRGLGTGITLGDIRAGKNFAKLIEEHNDPDAAYRALETMLPGTVFGNFKLQTPYRDVHQFETTSLAPLADAIHRLSTTPGPRELIHAFKTYRDAVFHFDSKFVEKSPQYGQLAKTARRDLGLTRRQFRKAIDAQGDVVVDLAKGFRDPKKVTRFAQEVEKVFGNWGKNGPDARKFLNNYSPFWQWARAATKFVFQTLPRDHPILTAIAASAQQMTRAEREKLGFAFDASEPLPEWMQGSIPDPLEPGGVIKLSNLTSFGSFGDPGNFYASNLLPPVFSAAVLAGVAGVNYKGDKLVSADGGPATPQDKIRAALAGTVESFIPFLNVTRSITGKGAAQGLSPAKTYPAATVESLREPREEISVPVSGSGGSSSGNPFLGSSSASSEGNPFLESSSSSSSGNPFLSKP